MPARGHIGAVLVLLGMLAAACGAILAIGRLQGDATAHRDAEHRLAELRLELAQIQDVPWGASPDEGDDPAAVREELQGAEQAIAAAIAALGRDAGLDERAILEPFGRSTDALWMVFDLVSAGNLDDTWGPSSLAARNAAQADAALRAEAARYRRASVDALTRARVGSAAVIVLLLGGFAWGYRRAARARRTAEALAAEKRRLLAASREEALTDALTGLRNRRALVADLAAACADPGRGPVLLALFDLDGFKGYNDTFGHPAGDALLARLGKRLAARIDGIGTAYRMGGDEFCILARTREEPDAIARLAASALTETGRGFAIGASYGTAVVPADAATPEDALRCADQRMYRHKASARVPARAGADALLASLAERTAVRLGRDAAEAEALAHAADLVRRHHERPDGRGDPDGLRGPLGARIIAVCDAFVALVGDRPQRAALSGPAALAELRAAAGTRFDPQVVEAFAAAVADAAAPAAT